MPNAWENADELIIVIHKKICNISLLTLLWNMQHVCKVVLKREVVTINTVLYVEWVFKSIKKVIFRSNSQRKINTYGAFYAKERRNFNLCLLLLLWYHTWWILYEVSLINLYFYFSFLNSLCSYILINPHFKHLHLASLKVLFIIYWMTAIQKHFSSITIMNARWNKHKKCFAITQVVDFFPTS